MKNKKFILRTFHASIPIDEDELEKVYAAIRTGTITILRRGWFNPSTFDSIVPDEAFMKTYQEQKKYEIREGKIDTYPPYPDLFQEVRDTVNRIAGEKRPPQIGG